VSFHHVAIATNDLDATHRFYTDVMGFDLVKVVAGETMEGGWSRHVFYDTHHGGLIAFWDIHDETLPEFDASISKGLGLPAWTNHLAFDAPTLEDLDAQRRRWLDHGEKVVEIDHGWCTSIYTDDPSGIMVEFCTLTRAFTAHDHDEARRLIASVDPATDIDTTPPPVEFFVAPKDAAKEPAHS
jgi:catechol 2,3-dioxygenase-like lactoylglutathione lyase family enzyme